MKIISGCRVSHHLDHGAAGLQAEMKVDVSAIRDSTTRGIWQKELQATHKVFGNRDINRAGITMHRHWTGNKHTILTSVIWWKYPIDFQVKAVKPCANLCPCLPNSNFIPTETLAPTYPQFNPNP